MFRHFLLGSKLSLFQAREPSQLNAPNLLFPSIYTMSGRRTAKRIQDLEADLEVLIAKIAECVMNSHVKGDKKFMSVYVK